jgi:hypothetical protein
MRLTGHGPATRTNARCEEFSGSARNEKAALARGLSDVRCIPVVLRNAQKVLFQLRR